MTRELRVAVQEKSFAGPDGAPRIVLRDIDFRMKLDEFIAIVGPSGAGKTTLLKIIAGLDRDFQGSVRFTEADGAPPLTGFVFQEPRLLPWRTVFENISLVLPPGGDRSAVARLLDEVGLAEFAHALPPRLSLGMARRVALVRALAIEPDLLLMDEPLVSLDRTTAERLRGLLVALWRARPCGIIFVTHDLREAVALADRILLFSAGPGRLMADIAVPLARDRRADAAAIDAACAAIAPQQDRAAES